MAWRIKRRRVEASARATVLEHHGHGRFWQAISLPELLPSAVWLGSFKNKGQCATPTRVLCDGVRKTPTIAISAVLRPLAFARSPLVRVFGTRVLSGIF